MKAKLLKKLRKKFSKNYEITRCGSLFVVRQKGNKFRTWTKCNIEDAKKCATEQIRKSIESYIDDYHKKHKRTFTYYPW